MVSEREACCNPSFWCNYELPSWVHLITNAVATAANTAKNIGLTWPFPSGTGIATSHYPTHRVGISTSIKTDMRQISQNRHFGDLSDPILCLANLDIDKRNHESLSGLGVGLRA